MVKLGLVTVLYNSNDVLDGFFKSLSVQTFKNYTLIMVDNSSSEETDNLIKQLSDDYQVSDCIHVKNNGNFGVAKGNNQGIELSIKNHTTHTVLINNDIEFDDPEFLSKLIYQAVNNNETLVIPKILFFDTRKIWMAGGDFVTRKGIIKHVGEGSDENAPEFNVEAHFNYAPTCVMLVNNKLFEEIGIMDEKYFVYYDDTDFLYRAHIKGHRIKYAPTAVVLHKVSSSTGGRESLFSLYYSNRNRLYFIRKNLKGFNFLTAMPFTLLTRIIVYMGYDKAQKAKLKEAVLEGLKMGSGN